MKTIPAARLFISGACALFAQALLATNTWYVATTGSDTSGNGSSGTPYRTIQKAVTAAVNGDVVLVGPGTYNTGVYANTGAGNSRVEITKNITVRSLQGAAQTIIAGAPNNTSTSPFFGANSTRCVYMTAGKLDGFTLANGFANAFATTGRGTFDMNNPVVSGGGVYAPINNRTVQVNNCIITGCGAYRGGGAHWATLNNCTVVSNHLNTTSGIGVWCSSVRNSIVVDNGDENYDWDPASIDATVFQNSCTTPEPGLTNHGVNHDGGSNITASPSFIPGTLQLATNSPCLNAGNNSFADGPRDAAGNARIIGGVVDMGAFESNFILYQRFPLTVINGSGSGSYLAGDVVPIVADTPPAWTTFTGWTGDVSVVASPQSASTTVTMPAAAAEVRATYSTPNPNDFIGTVPNIPQPVTVSNVTADALSLDPPGVRLGPVADSDVAFVSTVYTNAGTLIFPWSVNCEPTYDRLALIIDGVEVASITGEDSGTVTQFIAGDGPHVVQWIYIKDEIGNDGLDAGWFGTVTWIPDTLAAELGVPGKPIYFPYGQFGNALPFPYGFQGCFLDTSAPSGAIGNAAVKLGGLVAGASLVDDGETNGTEVVLSGAGLLNFQWLTSSQASDWLICTIDGMEAARISGFRSGWTTFTTNLLSVGTHIVRWSYAKSAESPGYNGLDCGWVDSVTWTQYSFVLTVENGTGSGTNAVGAVVSITANPAPDGYVFETWDGDTETIADLTSPTTTLVMPGRDTTVRPLYKVKTLALTVVNGRDAGAWPNDYHDSTGEPEGIYPANACVRIVANPAPLWQTFAQWTATPGVSFLDTFADISAFIMPTSGVVVTASYRPQSLAEKLAGALTIRGQPLSISAYSPSGVVAEATGGIRYNDPVVKLGGPTVGPNQSVSLSTTNFTGDGVLFFWWRGDCEAGYDGIKLVVNNALQSRLYSEKATNLNDHTIWHLYGFRLQDVTNITWRFTRDDSYAVHNNMVLIDRVTWIPQGMIDALDAGACIPNINAEYDPLFLGRGFYDEDDEDFEGEDGGVAWVHDAPGGVDAIRLGYFGYVTNNLFAQVAVTNFGTGILTWQWYTRSEYNYDRLEFLLNGMATNWISGKSATIWSNAAHVIANDFSKNRDENRGTKQILSFRYKKDADVSVYEDCGWLRNLVWMPTFSLGITKGSIADFTLQAPYDTLPVAHNQAVNGILPPGSLVTIIADPPPPEAPYFSGWTGNGVDLLDNPPISPNQTFVMPARDISLTATYSDSPPSTVPRYSLTVVGGIGSGSYTNGAVIAIAANTAPEGWTFTGWIGDIGTVLNPAAASTAVMIGTVNLVLQATYAMVPVESIIPSIIDVPGPVTVGNLTYSNIIQNPPAVRLGPVGDNETAFFEVVYSGAGTVIFPWSIDCEDGCDFMSFSVDGTPVASITGLASGTVTNFVAGSGPHTLRWAYTKDVSDAAGADAGTVGTVIWIPNELSAEFGVPGKPLYLPNGDDSVLLDLAPPANAISNIAAKLGGPTAVMNNAQTAVEAVYSGAGQLTFQWRTSSESNHDYLILVIDGQEAARISGTKDGWILFQTNLLTVADHHVRWTYKKDNANTAGMDCAWVDSVVWKQFAYLLTVENGSGSGSNNVGSVVAIVADTAPANFEFNAWDGDTENISDVRAAATTLIMPGRDITVRPLYKPQTLDVTVVNGRDAGAWPNAAHESTGEPEGAYPVNALVRIVANDAPLWQTFDRWVSTNGATFTDTDSPVSMFLMPPHDVTVEATYRPQTEAEKLAGALTVKGQPLQIMTYSPSGVVAEATGGVRYNDPVVRFGGPAVGAGQSASLSFTNFTGNGVLLFWVSASAETKYDRIQVLNGASVITEMVSPKCGRWHAATNYVWGASSLTIRFMRDSSYFVRENAILVDRMIWIPRELIDAVGFPSGWKSAVPNINAESTGFDGEDGGVAWVNDAPGGNSAIRFGRFGYVNNGQHTKLVATNANTGVLTWQWAGCSEADYDALIFGCDTVVFEPPKQMSGKEMSWATGHHVITNLPNLTREENAKIRHTFSFDYVKDADVSVFYDCTWLRAGVWTPTVQMSLLWATNTAVTLHPPFDTMSVVRDEARIYSIFPTGTTVTVQGSDPGVGYYFDRWVGDTWALNAGDEVVSPCTFNIPNRDFTLMATFTTNAPAGPMPPEPAPQSRITTFAMVPTASVGVKSGALLSAPLPSMSVSLTFEGTVQTGYDILFSPALAGPECVWQSLPVTFSEALGDTAGGRRLLRVYAEAPADAPQGFFRIQAR